MSVACFRGPSRDCCRKCCGEMWWTLMGLRSDLGTCTRCGFHCKQGSRGALRHFSDMHILGSSDKNVGRVGTAAMFGCVGVAAVQDWQPYLRAADRLFEKLMFSGWLVSALRLQSEAIMAAGQRDAIFSSQEPSCSNQHLKEQRHPL